MSLMAKRPVWDVSLRRLGDEDWVEAEGDERWCLRGRPRGRLVFWLAGEAATALASAGELGCEGEAKL